MAAVLGALLLAVPPAASAEEATPEPVAPRVVLGRFSTSYPHEAEHKKRAFNVELAAEAIHGKVIAPGTTFSFNDAVGERTASFGYARAAVIRDGMIAEGVGGGACQVASTLHAAALLSGLDVVARAPHSRPSAYIRVGLDATVSSGARGPIIDLKLKNPTAIPVTIHARAERGTLEVWFDAAGTERPEVRLTSEIVERVPFARVVERDERVGDDTARIKAFGIPGLRVRRTREIQTPDGRLRRDVRVDFYPPTSEVVQVAPSFDASRLSRRRPSPPSDVDEEWTPAAAVIPTAGASVVRPAPVQLRPSSLVVLDNAER